VSDRASTSPHLGQDVQLTMKITGFPQREPFELREPRVPNVPEDLKKLFLRVIEQLDKKKASAFFLKAMHFLLDHDHACAI
jgi:hypothetical protein